jgi:hypothetical protein
MPVIAKFYGVVVRLLCLRSLGSRIHAFYGDSEMVIDLATLRVLENNLPDTVKWMVLAWAREHRGEIMAGRWQAL